MEFRNKVIFIISYEEWGGMLMSKHHYAIELSKRGNTVYFINLPDKRGRMKKGEIKVSPTDYQHLFSVTSRFVHPYFLKFRFRSLYNLLASFHIGRIIKAVGKYPDIVWCFDAGNNLPLKYFAKSQLRIYMPVDGPFGIEEELMAAEKADIILSVTDRILDRYKNIDKPRLCVNHGVADCFINNKLLPQKTGQLHVGYSGSLLRADMDWVTFLKLIKSFPNIVFEFWGETNPKSSNIHLPQDISEEIVVYLDTLAQQPNVVLHGTAAPEKLAAGLMQMDLLLILLNLVNNHNNSHKCLEYLGTGKVIVSSFMGYYSNRPDLIEMVSADNNNEEFIPLFAKVIKNLDYYNSLQKQNERVEYAKGYTYASRIETIENFASAAIIKR